MRCSGSGSPLVVSCSASSLYPWTTRKRVVVNSAAWIYRNEIVIALAYRLWKGQLGIKKQRMAYQKRATQLNLTVVQAGSVHDGIDMIGHVLKDDLTTLAAGSKSLQNCWGIVLRWIALGFDSANAAVAS